MARFSFFSPFSSRDTFLFNGDVENDTDNLLTLLDEDIRFADIRGRFFDKATGERDGTVTSVVAGPAELDEEGNPTGRFIIALRISDANADRSRFDDLYLDADPLNIMGLLAGGDDLFDASAGADFLRGAQGDDVMRGNGGDDTLGGGTGDDTVLGGTGDDRLIGNDGADRVLGGVGDDTVFGNDDNDFLKGGGGADRIKGGEGEDRIIGGSGRDTIFGGADDDDVSGGGGRDDLSGGAGDDEIDGGGGADTITGGAGDDTLTGGARADTFSFDDAAGDDRITDFTLGLDLIQVTGGLSFADIDISSVGSDALISFGATSITLVGVDATALSEDDFLF